ncbi:collagen alpha-2(I) chain-like [Equus quagga]|uniref:collagen alpha-2(I) chain-like n=1 Tax=Equus quagga TaxID=89248 RepID=UPI001EE26162|nr:collagen alpha-2(I) chain-like [Equus quagga]
MAPHEGRGYGGSEGRGGDAPGPRTPASDPRPQLAVLASRPLSASPSALSASAPSSRRRGCAGGGAAATTGAPGLLGGPPSRPDARSPRGLSLLWAASRGARGGRAGRPPRSALRCDRGTLRARGCPGVTASACTRRPRPSAAHPRKPGPVSAPGARLASSCRAHRASRLTLLTPKLSQLPAYTQLFGISAWCAKPCHVRPQDPNWRTPGHQIGRCKLTCCAGQPAYRFQLFRVDGGLICWLDLYFSGRVQAPRRQGLSCQQHVPSGSGWVSGGRWLVE